MQRLKPLGVVERRSERAGDVGGDAVAAERDGVGVDEMPVGEHRERGGTGAEIDAGDAKLGLVGGDYGEGARVGRGNRPAHPKMATLDAERQIANGHLVGGDGMDIDAEPFAAHAERIADAIMVVEPVAGGQRVQHRALLAGGILAGAGDDAQGVVLAHGAGRKRHARREAFAFQPAAGDGDMQLPRR